jgi:hypothetical protein
MYKCKTKREGQKCAFMEKNGCSFEKCGYETILEQCVGCDKVIKIGEESFCKSYLKPSEKWKSGNCNLASHIKKLAKEMTKVNPLKASKRSMKK